MKVTYSLGKRDLLNLKIFPLTSRSFADYQTPLHLKIIQDQKALKKSLRQLLLSGSHYTVVELCS